MRDRRWQLAVILLAIAALGGVILLLPAKQVQTHNILHHLYFLPLIAAGMLFDWRRVALITLWAATAHAPHLSITWQRNPVRAADHAAELAIFAIAAITTAVFSERERRQRKRVEQTKQELEDVNQELRQNVEKLRRAERLSAVGQLSAGLAHEIRNPLASISGAAGILMRANATPEDVQDCLQIIQAESSRLSRLLSNFLEFARPRTLRLQPAELGPLLESVVALAGHQSSASHARLECQTEPGIEFIECDPEQLKQVLLNLVLNAIQASPAGGLVALRAQREGNSLTIDVSDEGRGILPELRERIFEPFFTTRETGTGLGLAVAAKIVEQHGGTLSALPNDCGGATLRLELPLREVTVP